jgi:lauroyl/myristoyl acyltransferase
VEKRVNTERKHFTPKVYKTEEVKENPEEREDETNEVVKEDNSLRIKLNPHQFMNLHRRFNQNKKYILSKRIYKSNRS